jgi:hypothetical protein
MRVNLIAQACDSHDALASGASISLTVRPACGIPGDFCYDTNRMSLLHLLRKDTELHSVTLERFEIELAVTKRARLLGVEMSERTLERIGYFVD